MKLVSFHNEAFKNFTEWQEIDNKIFLRIVELIKETVRNPFGGIGKPEPLKHKMKGYWSRRINEEHRLIYKVTDEAIIIISCKYHYK